MSNERPVAETCIWLRTLHRSARGVAVVAGVFSVVVCAMLVVGMIRSGAADPLNTPALEKLLEELEARPDDQSLKTQIRELDLLARRAYFAGNSFLRTGAILLLAGVGLLLAALKTSAVLSRRLPRPGKSGAEDERVPPGAAGRGAVAALGGALVLTTVALVVLFGVEAGPGLSGSNTGNGNGGDPGTAVTEQPPKREEILRNWPGFRGPDGNAHAPKQPAPISWNGTSGKGIIWKVPVPQPGFSSPVVWGHRLFLTGADKKTREVYCFDTGSGKLLWRGNTAGIPGSPATLPETTEDTGLAAPTPATDGRRVYAIFGTGNVVAFDFKGQRVWARNLGVPVNGYGHSSSLLVHKGTLLVQLDHEEGAKLLGLDALTGKTFWEADREVAASWASPILVDDGSGAQVVLSARPMVAGYEPEDGTELWSVECLKGDAEVGSSPAYAAGRLFVANDIAKCSAINLEDVKVLWEWDEDLPEAASPVATAKLLFLPTSSGAVTCLDAAEGKVIWQHEFNEGFYSSPVLVGDRVYLTDREGVTHVLAAAGEFKLLGSSPLGEKSDCTPAVVNGRIYMRGSKHLFCIGKAR